MVRVEATSIDGPIGDAEIPLLEHLRELRGRLMVILIPFGIVGLVVFFVSNKPLHLLFSHLFGDDLQLYVYSPTEWLSVRLLFAFLCAFSVTIPLMVYELFAFLRPGLYPSERKFFLMVTIPSLCSYGLGALFAYLFVLPWVFRYLIAYSSDIAHVLFSAKRVFSIVLYAALGFGLVFQIPFMMALAVKLRLVTPEWLRSKRFIIYGLIIGVAFFIITDPTGISMIMAAVAIVLFEVGLLVTRVFGRRRR